MIHSTISLTEGNADGGACEDVLGHLGLACAQGRCGVENVTFKGSQNLPYLQAVIKEALRMHPAIGLPLWRVAPEGGAVVCDQLFPAGTIVGLSTWCSHHRQCEQSLRSERMYHRALTGKEKALGPDHISTLATVHDLGILYRYQGKMA